jgi:hypothetical protein
VPTPPPNVEPVTVAAADAIVTSEEIASHGAAAAIEATTDSRALDKAWREGNLDAYLEAYRAREYQRAGIERPDAGRP